MLKFYIIVIPVMHHFIRKDVHGIHSFGCVGSLLSLAYLFLFGAFVFDAPVTGDFTHNPSNVHSGIPVLVALPAHLSRHLSLQYLRRKLAEAVSPFLKGTTSVFSGI